MLWERRMEMFKKRRRVDKGDGRRKGEKGKINVRMRDARMGRKGRSKEAVEERRKESRWA